VTVLHLDGASGDVVATGVEEEEEEEGEAEEDDDDEGEVAEQ
jgi:hypothetical protein